MLKKNKEMDELMSSGVGGVRASNDSSMSRGMAGIKGVRQSAEDIEK